MLGLGKFKQKPLHSAWIERGIDLDGRMARDGGGNACAKGRKILIPLRFA